MEKVYTKSIRNVALLGHSGGGKTSLAESMLYISRLTDRLGNVTDGNTVCDYDPEEVKRGYSISAATAPLLWNGAKINILDTPGFFDFEAEARQCVRAADAAIIVVDGKAGIEVGTEIGWKLATKAGIPKASTVSMTVRQDSTRYLALSVKSTALMFVLSRFPLSTDLT